MAPVNQTGKAVVVKSGLALPAPDPNSAKATDEEIESLDQTFRSIVAETGNVLAQDPAKAPPPPPKVKRSPPFWARWLIKDESKPAEQQPQ